MAKAKENPCCRKWYEVGITHGNRDGYEEGYKHGFTDGLTAGQQEMDKVAAMFEGNIKKLLRIS